MKNKLLIILLHLNNKAVIRKLYVLYYLLAVKTVTFILRKNKTVESLYLKGSFTKDSFIPVISDLDFFLVGNANFETRRDIEKVVKRIGIIFPMVSDFDFHTKQDFSLLRSFGGLKYIDTHEWSVLFGENIEFSYKFNPRKLNIDILHEIYFQFEWLFRNIKKRTVECEFSTRKIHRQYQKVQDLLSYANSYYETKYYIPRRNVSFNKRWIKYSNEKIIILFNELIENNVFIRKNKKIYFYEFKDRDFSRILNESFFKKRVKVIGKENFNVSSDKEVYLTLENLKLFYFIGSIDSFLLFDWIKKAQHSLTAKYIELLYYTRLLERRWNTKHDEFYYSNNHERSKEIISFIESYIRFEKFSPIDFSHMNIHVTVSASKEDLDFYTVDYQVPDDFFQFHIHFGEESVSGALNSLCLLHINMFVSERLIDHRNTLLNFAIDWVFGAENILVGDISSSFNLTWTPAKFAITRIVREEKKSSLWIASSLLWNSILPILKFDTIEKIDDVLTYQFSGKKPSSDYFKALIKSKKIKNLSYDIGIEYDKKYLNNSKTHALSSFQLHPLISPLLVEDEFGFMKISDTYVDSWGKIKSFLTGSINDPYYNLEILVSYINLLRPLDVGFDPINICLFDGDSWRAEGPISVIAYDDNSLKFRTINDESKVECRVSLVNYANASDRFNFYWFSLENELTVETSSLNLENGNIELSWGGEELFQMQFFLFTPGINNFDTLPLELALKGSETYNLRLKKHEVYQNFNDEDFEFYKTFDYQVLKDFNPIGKVYRGFYKIVLRFNKQLSGGFYLKNKNNSARYQRFSVKNSKDCILYLYESLQATELVICSELGVENPINVSLTVDILKYKRKLF